MDAGPFARDLMRSRVVTVEPHESLADASAVLRLGRMRGVPVLERGRMVGELQLAGIVDLARRTFEAERDTRPDEGGALGRLPVREAMVRPRPGVDGATTLAEVARHLRSDAPGYVPVLLEDRLIGIVTESDVLRAALEAERLRPGAADPAQS